jgi:Fe-Mn family superoxide dismutase
MMKVSLAFLGTTSALKMGIAYPNTRMGAASMSLVSGEEQLLSRFGLPTEQLTTSRRSALGLSFAAAVTPLFALGDAAHAADGMFSVPPLTYAYDALEPHIDAATMKFHHDFHHQAYVNNLNKAMAGKPDASLVSLMPGAKAAKLNNAGGGHYNHCMFWSTMGPKCGGAPEGDLAKQIDVAFGSFDEFKSAFSAAAAGVFGSGWAWLAVAGDGSVKIVTTPNQDNPLMDGATEAGLIPIMGIDVWEHAYYLKYQNRRPEYIAAFFKVINWAKVGEYYATAKSGSPIAF